MGEITIAEDDMRETLRLLAQRVAGTLDCDIETAYEGISEYALRLAGKR